MPASSSGSPSPQPVETSRSAAPSATPTSAVGLVVNGNGTDLTAPQSATTRTIPHSTLASTCYGLGFDPGFAGGCNLVDSRLGKAVLQIEAKGTEERTLLWTLDGNRANLALRRVRTLAEPAGSVNAQDGGALDTRSLSSDINNDGTRAFVVETPSGGGGKPPLATLDVVQTSGLVGLHRDLHGGYAQKANGGGLETWTALDNGRFEHSVFQYQSGQWRIVADGTVEKRQVPTNTGGF